MKQKKKSQQIEPKSKKPFNIKLLILLIVNTIIVFTLYCVGNHFEFYPTFWICFGLAIVLSLAYFIYNRGMTRNHVSADMLPSDWSEEEKTAYITDAETRKKKSKWLLTLIIPLIFTLVFDFVNLFYLDDLRKMLEGIGK